MLRLIRVSIPIVLALALGSSPTPLAAGSGKAVAPPVRGSVSGRVVDATGKPVAGARVALALDERDPLDVLPTTPLAHITTGRSGRFSFPGLEPRRYLLEVVKPGHALYRRDALQVTVEEPSIDLGALRLEPGLTLRGEVVDWKGVPLAGVTVALDGELPRALSSCECPMDGIGLPLAKTDAKGRFAFRDLSPGDRVTVLFDDVGTAEPVQAEIPATQPVRLVVSPLATLSGRVVDENGRPPAWATVSAKPEAAGPEQSAPANEDGHFQLGIQGGRLNLWATAEGTSAKPETLEVKAGETVGDLLLVLRPTAGRHDEVRVRPDPPPYE